MKPDWKDAPAWANWLAMDMDGRWVWWENEPYFFDGDWAGGGRYEVGYTLNDAWDSKESRP